MKRIDSLYWRQRIHIIEHFDLGVDAACEMLQITEHEYQVAKQFVADGLFAPMPNFKPEPYYDLLPESVREVIPRPSSLDKHIRKKRVVSTDTYTRKSSTAVGKAYLAVGNEPIDLEKHAKAHNVSINVLRQRKRFDPLYKHGEDQPNVTVKKDRISKKLYIKRETLDDVRKRMMKSGDK